MTDAGGARGSTRAHGGRAPATLAIEVEASPDLNLAMFENHVPLVRRLALTNRGDRPLRELEVTAELQPGFSGPWTGRLSEIPADGTFGFDKVELPLDRTALANQVERSTGALVVTVRDASGEVVATSSTPVGVLAYNEWTATTVPQILAAFVIPNHPAIQPFLARGREGLRRLAGDPAFDGYQAKSSLRVARMAQAIYEAVQALEVTYVEPPASFEKVGQKIRTPEQVLDQRMGTCIDLSVLLAACLEQVGLHPLLFHIDGHAFPGVWLHEEDEVPEAVTDDGVRFRKLAALERVLVFDSSAVAKRPIVPFAEAMRQGLAHLEDDDEFRWALDVHAARGQRFLPLPPRVVGAYAPVEAVPVVAPAASSGPVVGERPAAVTGSGANRTARIARIETWKQRLLDTSLRNRLLNFRADAKGVLPVLGQDVAGLEDALARGGKLLLAGRPTLFDADDPRDRRRVEEHAGADAVETLLRQQRAKGVLHTAVDGGAVYGRATAIYRDARESIEETGTNSLCLALGMLTWYESDASDTARLAPILLLPVTLERDSRASTFSLAASGEEIRLNATLLEKLRGDHGIAMPELAELPEDDAGIDVRLVLNTVRAAVMNLRRWDVVDGAYLANFSFAKFLMWADLDQRAASLLESPVVNHLVNGKGAAFPGGGDFIEPRDLDRRYRPGDLLCPLDADASQLAAVAAAAEGRSFVLQGPPGTGKSQSITNLIAHCLAQGKRVLFVAEKMAALEVVHRRLGKIGLTPFCLELYSNKVSKPHVLEQLQAALDATAAAPPPAIGEHQAQLGRERDRLDAYAEALHRDRGGLSAFRALGRLTALRDAGRVELPPSCATTPAQIAATIEAAGRLQQAAAALPPLADVAWRECAMPRWDLGLPGRVGDVTARLATHLDGVGASAARIAARLGVVPPAGLADADALGTVATLVEQPPARGDELLDRERWSQSEATATALVKTGRARDEAQAALAARYSEGLYALDLSGLRARFERFARSFFLIAWWMLRGARRTLAGVTRGERARPAEIVDDLQRAITVREQTQTLERQAERGRALFGPAWDAAARDWPALERALGWARELHGALARLRLTGPVAGLLEAGARDPSLARDGAALRAHVSGARAALRELREAIGWRAGGEGAGDVDDLATLRRTVDGWRAQLGELHDWFSYQDAARGLRGLGGGAIVDDVEAARLAASGAAHAAERSALEAWLVKEATGDPVLSSFHGDPHRALVESFAAHDRALLGETQALVAARLGARMPRANPDVAASSELGILQRELKKKARHLPLRKLFRQIPELLARLKPCFLMSPLSVAQYLEPGAVKFDLVVFDEASQIPTHDAIGALARGASAVVVGDSRQLPPTTFFQQAADDDEDDGDENDLDELESILDECVAARLPERRLDWHYRSRHESLIAFSNHRYYDNRLNTFPSAAAQVPHLGVSLRAIEGVYAKGGDRNNPAEAAALVDELVSRLRDPVQARRSIGVVTFSKAQQELIEDLLDQRRQQHPELNRFFDEKTAAEPVIVKNLENIQGDERDVMLFSICYGPDLHGRVAMNFGPLNRDGGERRLNVAVTRAREELVVFSTLRPEQIDLTRTEAAGVKDLKTFLDYARRGPRAIAEALEVSAESRFDSPFEEEVCSRLRARGWTVDTQVGCAGYRIDLGVRHPEQPGRYVLGVECDGAYYHSARSARERDRLRGEVLAQLGWKCTGSGRPTGGSNRSAS